VRKEEKAGSEILKFFHKGYGLVELKEEICTKFNVSESRFFKYLEKVNKELEKVNETSKREAYTLHLNRYEYIFRNVYKKLEGLGDEYDSAHYKYFVALIQTLFKSLFHKEKLLGLREKDVIVKIINNQVVIDKKGERRGLHKSINPKLENLSMEEKKELHGLIMKSQVLNIEGVWPIRRVPEGMELQDIKHIEEKKEDKDDIPENVIKKMKVEKDEVKEIVKKSILENIEKKMQEKSKEQLITLIEKKKKGEVL
jgi:hypothetical protein